MKYKAELNQLIIVANNTLSRKGEIIHLTFYDKRIIASVSGLDDDTRQLSARMSVKNLIIWLNGFIEGLDF